MVADVAAQATAQAGVSLGRVPVVMGSAFGEMATTVEMLGERERDGQISPTRFHNSVHNNSAAQLSIAQQNRAFSTSISAGHQTVAVVLLEAMLLLGDRGGEVLAIVADEPLPSPLLREEGGRAVAAALVLVAEESVAASPGATKPLAWLTDLRQETDPMPSAVRPVELISPCAAILPLMAAIGAGSTPGRFDLAAGRHAHWSISFSPPTEANEGQERER